MRDTETWDARGGRSWQVYFGLVVAAVAVFVVAVPSGRDGSPWWELALLGAMVLWYLGLGRAVMAESHETWRGWLFQAVLLALFAGSLAVASTVSFLLFALCPLAYMCVGLTRAHVLVTAYAFAPAVVMLVLDGPRTLPVLLALGLVVTAVSIVSALTTARSERISEERAALIRELEATRAELARLSHEAGMADERQRLAGEIHDTVAQGLSSVVMLVEAADAVLDRDPAAARKHLRLAARSARENLDETRAIVAALAPKELAGAALADALARLVERFSTETGTAVRLSTVGDRPSLPTRTEVVLLRVVQEALHNVRKHAAATTVAVELASGAAAVTVRVRDDGAGFDQGAVGPGYGLIGMRSRVEQIGGTLTVTALPDRGTTILAEVPA